MIIVVYTKYISNKILFVQELGRHAMIEDDRFRII